jgi:hypothetical protein
LALNVASAEATSALAGELKILLPATSAIATPNIPIFFVAVPMFRCSPSFGFGAEFLPSRAL